MIFNSSLHFWERAKSASHTKSARHEKRPADDAPLFFHRLFWRARSFPLFFFFFFFANTKNRNDIAAFPNEKTTSRAGRRRERGRSGEEEEKKDVVAESHRLPVDTVHEQRRGEPSTLVHRRERESQRRRRYRRVFTLAGVHRDRPATVGGVYQSAVGTDRGRAFVRR